MTRHFQLNGTAGMAPYPSEYMGLEMPDINQDFIIKWVVVPGATVAVLSIAGALFFKKRKRTTRRRRRRKR